MTANGAFRPLRRVPGIVSFLNPKPALSLGGGNGSSCPTPAVRDTRRDRLNWVESEQSPRRLTRSGLDVKRTLQVAETS